MPTRAHDGDRLRSTSRLWPDERKGPWLLSFQWQVLGGRAECIGLEITSATETIRGDAGDLLPEVGRPLRTTTLRALQLAELLHEERVRADHLAVRVDSDRKPADTDTPPQGMRDATRRRLQLVADVYEKARADGRVPPNQAVADKLKISIGAAANLASRARKAGLLPPAE